MKIDENACFLASIAIKIDEIAPKRRFARRPVPLGGRARDLGSLRPAKHKQNHRETMKSLRFEAPQLRFMAVEGLI